MSVRKRSAMVALAGCATFGLAGALAAPARAAGCLATTAGTAEEQLVDRPQPQALITRGGFADRAPAFVSELCAAADLAGARDVVGSNAASLWQFAVDRAQGRVAVGDLSAGDDRPLYWTRLQLTRAVRQYAPSFALTAADRAALIADLDRISRGQADIDFPPDRSTKRVLVSGFDPFGLSTRITNGNPSGASALALDGTALSTPSGPAHVEAFLLPVRWRDFADGVVEGAFSPYLPGVDLFATTSQGSPGRFDLEVHNGAWRGGKPDNEGACYLGHAPVTTSPQPEWTQSTLPFTVMTAGTGAFPVAVNRSVSSLPGVGAAPLDVAVTTCEPVTNGYALGISSSSGPPSGSLAREGGGGNYLSNEVAYRATLLRDALHLGALPGGHIHTPVLSGLGDPATEITNPTFEANREAISGQLRQLLVAAVGSL